jgi:hypothetical protein
MFFKTTKKKKKRREKYNTSLNNKNTLNKNKKVVTISRISDAIILIFFFKKKKKRITNFPAQKDVFNHFLFGLSNLSTLNLIEYLRPNLLYLPCPHGYGIVRPKHLILPFAPIYHTYFILRHDVF